MFPLAFLNKKFVTVFTTLVMESEDPCNKTTEE